MLSIDKLYHVILTSGAHAIIFIIFLTILYFTIIIKTEHHILSQFIVNGAKNYGIDKIPINDTPIYNNFLKLLKNKAYTEEQSFQSHNNDLKLKSIKSIGIVIASFILGLYIISKVLNIKHYNLDYHSMIRDGLLLVLVVGLFEILFLKYVVLEYSFYNFNDFLYDYVKKNALAIKKYVPSIILYFMVDIPNYSSPFTKFVNTNLSNTNLSNTNLSNTNLKKILI